MSARFHHDTHGGWSNTDYLLALVADTVDYAARASLVGTVKKMPEPHRVPRPGDKPPERKSIGWAAATRNLMNARR